MPRNQFVAEKIYPRMAAIQGLQRQIDRTKDPAKKEALRSMQQMHQDVLQEEYAKLGVESPGGEPYADWSFVQKLGKAIQKALASGQLTSEAAAILWEMAQPENLLLMAAVLGGYATLHGTPAAPALWASDAYLLTRCGVDAALGMQQLYLAVNGATTEWELDQAGQTIVEIASGPLADAIFSFALYRAGKAGKFLKRRFKGADVDSHAAQKKALENVAPKGLPPITPPTNRGGLRQAMGQPPAGMTNPNAHHDLPWTMRDWFAQRGLNVNDPRFGRWVEGTPPGGHQRWSAAFDAEWRQFRLDNPGATADEVIAFMNRLRTDPRFQ